MSPVREGFQQHEDGELHDVHGTEHQQLYEAVVNKDPNTGFGSPL